MLERPDFGRIRQEVSILTAAARLAVPVAPGNKIRCCNPQGHNNGDRNPSVSISPEYGTFRCWVCSDIRGDVIDFVRLYGRMDWKESVAFLRTCGASGSSEVPKRLVVPKPTRVLLEAHVEAMEALYELASPIDLRCRTYLEGRKINPEVANLAGVRCLVSPVDAKARLIERLGREHPGIGAVLNKEGNLRFHMHRLLFPYWNEDGRIVYLQGRDISGRAASKELAAHVPPTMPWIPAPLDEQLVVVTEGVIDGLTAMTNGYRVFGLPGARTWQPWWAEYLFEHVVALGLDGDAAGRAATPEILKDLQGVADAAFDLQVPDGEDLNSIALKASVRELIERACALHSER